MTRLALTRSIRFIVASLLVSAVFGGREPNSPLPPRRQSSRYPLSPQAACMQSMCS
jgi:hypothetical protein